LEPGGKKTGLYLEPGGRKIGLYFELGGESPQCVSGPAEKSVVSAVSSSENSPYSRNDSQEFVSHSSEETIAKGREIATSLRPPVIVTLSGELGSGKTTLTKGIISGLGAAREEDVTSPTFTLVHLFHTGSQASAANGSGTVQRSVPPCNVYHVDLYRIENFTDLESLGLEDALAEQSIVIIEWPDRFTFRTDWPHVDIRFEHAGGDSRRIAISGLTVEHES
jgi:tRNA threonylcarbamoyladenosine biosynthesis protein TsaE